MLEIGTRPQYSALLPESPYFWPTEQVPCPALSICGTVTQFQEQDCSTDTSGAVKLPVPHQGQSPLLLGNIIQTGQKLTVATISFSKSAYEKLAFMVMILHIRRNWPQFLLDRIGLEQ